MSTNPVPAPQKKSNVLWWVLGIFCAGVVVLGLSALVLASYFLKDARIRGGDARVEISTPAGRLTVAKNAGQETGLPIYPGASAIESKGANIEFSTPEDERVGVAAAHYHTSDPFEKVDAWYRKHLGPEFTREEGDEHTHKVFARGVTLSSRDIAFISDQDDLVRVVAIKRKWDGTEIALARIGKQETQ